MAERHRKYISLREYDLYPDMPLTELQNRIDEVLRDNPDVEDITFGVDVDEYNSDISFFFYGYRMETQEEAELREEATKRTNDIMKEFRRKQYEALKKEFEEEQVS